MLPMTQRSAPDALHPVSGCTCARLRRLPRRMTALHDRELAPTGLRLTRYSLLATLRREAGDGGVAVSNLAAATDMDRTTLTRNLRPLRDQGLVALEADPADAGVRRALITAKGRAMFVDAIPGWRTAQHFVDRTLGEGSVGALHDWLDSVTAAFHAGPSEARTMASTRSSRTCVLVAAAILMVTMGSRQSMECSCRR